MPKVRRRTAPQRTGPYTVWLVENERGVPVRYRVAWSWDALREFQAADWPLRCRRLPPE